MDEDNVYGSGLNADDWRALRDAIWPFLHAEDPTRVPLPTGLPEHLRNHPVIRFLCKYRETGEDEYLEQGGQLLIPSGERFGWYAPLTK